MKMDYSRCPDFLERWGASYMAKQFWLKDLSYQLMRDVGCPAPQIALSKQEADLAWAGFMEVLQPHNLAAYPDHSRRVVVLFPLTALHPHFD